MGHEGRVAVVEAVERHRWREATEKSPYDPGMLNHPDDSDFDLDDDAPVFAIRRSRAVRWTAILIVASFAFAGLSSLSHWW